LAFSVFVNLITLGGDWELAFQLEFLIMIGPSPVDEGSLAGTVEFICYQATALCSTTSAVTNVIFYIDCMNLVFRFGCTVRKNLLWITYRELPMKVSRVAHTIQPGYSRLPKDAGID
jgi:hypothetical protein